MDPVSGGVYGGGLSCSWSASSYDGSSFVSWCRVVLIASVLVLVAVVVVVAVVAVVAIVAVCYNLINQPVTGDATREEQQGPVVSKGSSHLLRYGHFMVPNINTFFFAWP